MHRSLLPAVLGATLGALYLAPLPAVAQRIEVQLEAADASALSARGLGAAGGLELLRGVARGALDPADRRHAGIALLELAPRAADGQVLWEADVELIRPVDPADWNGSILVLVPDGGSPLDPDPELLAMGFALLQVGWRGDLQPGEGRLTARLPVAVHPDGTPVTGTVRDELIPDAAGTSFTLDLSYPARSTDPSTATLSVRPFQLATRRSPEDLRWRFEGPDRIAIDRPSGVDDAAIYEFVYEARDPIVHGIALAALRDVVGWARAGAPVADGGELLPPQASGTVAVGYGAGAGARLLRDFVYQGFNEGPGGGRVLDGMHVYGAGAGRTSLNAPFAQPGRTPRQHEDLLYPGFDFPFTYGTHADPIGGGTDGILLRCSSTGTCPLVMHTDGEGEYWQARASLVVTDPGGGAIELPPNVRVYALAGAPPASAPPFGGQVAVVPDGAAEAGTRSVCAYPANPLDVTPHLRALTAALHRWVVDGTEPPRSRYPSIADRALVTPASSAFANIDGVLYTGIHAPLRTLEAGVFPPVPRAEGYPVLVPRIDGDGNMLDGIRHPFHRIAGGTYTGWNVRAEGFAGGELCSDRGAYFPFARTRNDREESFDRRQSFRERYPDAGTWLRAVEWATQTLAEEGYLLPADAAHILEEAPARFR